MNIAFTTVRCNISTKWKLNRKRSLGVLPHTNRHRRKNTQKGLWEPENVKKNTNIRT